MANRTDKEAYAIHGTNPQNLVEYIIRQKIYQTTYWKESCFALTAETLVEKAVELRAAGGTYGGGRKPTPFMCLILKMLQIQPTKEIIVEYIRNEDFKYVRLLGAFYMRLVGRPQEVYQYLEPLYNDYRKVRIMTLEGQYELRHVDEVVDDMLFKDHLFDIAMPRLPARWALEKAGTLEPRVSALDQEFDEAALQEEAEAAAAQAQAAREQLEDVAAGAGAVAGGDRYPEEREEGGRTGNGHSREYEEDRRRDSPERKKEKWKLSRDEKREQASRRRSASRSPSRSRSPVRDRRERDRDRDRDRDRRRDDYDDDDYDRRRDDRDRRRVDRDDRDRRRDDDGRGRRRDEYDRDRRDDYDRDRARERRRSRSRSRDRVRERRDRSRSAERRPSERKDRDKGDSRKDSGRDKGSKRAVDAEDPEIAEQNALRASLGLKPLK